MAFKRSKMKQTDFTTGGRDISNTAIPLWQKNLTRMNDYLDDPTSLQDKYMQKYYSGDSVDWSDAMRDYQRAMSKTTANNYSATSGGYSSSGQRAYDDNQRGWNDYISRLRNQGILNSYNMASNDYQNMLGANSAYQNAYGVGENYSKIDQYNDLASKANKNWYSGVLKAAGQAGMASNNPWGMAIGAAAYTTGDMLGNNAGDMADSMFNNYWGSNSQGGQGGTRGTQDESSLAGAFNKGAKGINMLKNDWNGDKNYFSWFKGK